MSVSPPRGGRSRYNHPHRLHLSPKCSSRDALSHKQLTSCPLLDTFSRLRVTWTTVATTLRINISILCLFSNNCWVPAVEFMSRNDGFARGAGESSADTRAIWHRDGSRCPGCNGLLQRGSHSSGTTPGLRSAGEERILLILHFPLLLCTPSFSRRATGAL